MMLPKLAVTAGLCFGLLHTQSTFAQSGDTLRMTLQQTEQTFLQQNYQLLAQHYNVLGDSALIHQARLWDNPTLTIDQNVYANHRFFEHDVDANGNPQGQFYVQIQQLILLGGKRHKQIKLASTTAGITQLQLNELLANLRQQLRDDFYTVAQLEGNQRLYRQENSQLDKLIIGMRAQFSAGNIAQKDLLRVQALQINLLQEMTENGKSLEDTQAELRTLLRLTGEAYLQPVIPDTATPATMPAQSLAELTDLARKNNSTYLIQQQQVEYQKQNYAYQKALAVPDLTVGPNYDRNSNYTPNYFGLTLGIPLPLLNRNQGNIKSAQYNIKQEETTLQEADLELQNNVRNAYRKLALTLALSSEQQRSFYRDYNTLYNNIISSYNARQISLLEFIDYFNDYEDIREKQLQQELNIHLAQDALNYQVDVDVAH